jgi:hypothetical protein
MVATLERRANEQMASVQHLRPEEAAVLAILQQRLKHEAKERGVA